MKVLYGKLAKYYDKYYRHHIGKDYKKEAEHLDRIFKKHNVKSILELACGTGGHAVYLSKKYNVVGLDFNKEMVDIAKKKVRIAKFIQGDMKRFKLNRKFDAVMCMFSAIDYNKNIGELKRTFRNIYNHLNDGGVVLFDTHFFLETFEDGYKNMAGFDEGNTSLARFCISRKYDRIGKLYFSYILRKKNKFNYFKDVHTIGLFTKKQYINELKKIGFNVKVENGFPGTKDVLFIGVKR